MNPLELVRPEVRDLVAYRAIEELPGAIRLDANESPWPLEPELAEAFRHALDAAALHRYPDAAARRLKEAIAQRLGGGVSPAQVMVGNGSDELIGILVATFSAARSRRPRILVPVPTFSMYEIIARGLGAEVVKVPLGEDFSLNAAALLDAAGREMPNVIFLASPNNPTGNRFDTAAIERVVERSDVVVVVDEAYVDFCGGSLVRLVQQHPNAIVMRSFSKVGLAGLRLGCLVAPLPLLGELEKVRLPYNVNTLTQAFGVAALSRPDLLDARVRRTVEQRERLARSLAVIPGVEVFPSDANFVLVRVDADAAALHARLLARKLVVRDLSRPGPLAGCLRITVGLPHELDALLEALPQELAALRGG